MTGVRQFTACAFFLLGMQFILKKSFLKYFLSIFAGSLFHQTVWILLPLYFIPFKYLYNKTIMITIFFITFFIGNVEYIVFYIKDLSEFLSYYFNFGTRYIDGYIYRVDRFFITGDMSLGLGYYFIIASNFFLLFLSSNIVQKNNQLKPYYFIFFLSCIMYNLFHSVSLLNRLNEYFLISKPIVLAFTIYYFFHIRKNILIGTIIVGLFLVMFLAMIILSTNTCSPYNFKL